MVASWYSPKNAEVMSAGVFHYEQSMALKPYCETAIYYPYDADLDTDFSVAQEKGLLTYRRRLSKINVPKLGGILKMVNMFSDLNRICKEYRPNVLHAHCADTTGTIVALYGKLFHYPVVITEHSPIEQMRLNVKTMRRRIGYAYRNSDANVCVSIHSMTDLKKNFPDCQFQVIYNGIYSPETIEMDAQTYRVEGKINCCIVAAFYSKDIKGYQFLLPAIAKLKEDGLPIVLHICGGGDYFDYYRNMAKELDIEDCCVFYGNCTKAKVYSIVSQMDFNISASLYECSGVSVEEALLLGKPMLVTKSGGANSLVTEDVAIVVDKGSTEALVEGIKEMVSRLDFFDSERIKAYAFENFEIDQVSQRYMALYKKLLEEKK